MPTSSAGTDLSDALAKLRIQRAEPRKQRSWRKSLMKILLVATALLGVAAIAIVLVSRNGWISAGKNWSSVPEIMQSRVEGRVATVAVESGRSADATVVATGYLES